MVNFRTYLNGFNLILNENRIWNEIQAREVISNMVYKNTLYARNPDVKKHQEIITQFIFNLVKKEKSLLSKVSADSLRSVNIGDTTDYNYDLSISEWDIKDAEKGTLYAFPRTFFIGRHPINDKIEHITEWLVDLVSLEGINALNQLRGIQSLDIAYQHADKYFAEKNKRAEEASAKTELTGTKTILEFSNGAKWVEVFSKECLDSEGKRMGHCVGSYASRVEGGGTKIFSLRDKKNEPHITIEFDTDDGVILQIKGKQNRPPVEEYWKYVAKFLELPFVKNIETSDFDTKYLSKEEADELFTKKPNFAPAEWLYKKHGMTVNVLEKIKSTLDEWGLDRDYIKQLSWSQRDNTLVLLEEPISKIVDLLQDTSGRSDDNALEWAYNILSGDDILDIDYRISTNDIDNMFTYNLSEDFDKALLNYTKKNYNDEDVEKVSDAIRLLEENNDDMYDQLKTAYYHAIEVGTQDEISNDFWDAIKDWDADDAHLEPPKDGYLMDSAWRLKIDIDDFFKHFNTDAGEFGWNITYEHSFYINKDGDGIKLDSPRYGWSGFDGKTAEEYLKDETDLLKYLPKSEKEVA